MKKKNILLLFILSVFISLFFVHAQALPPPLVGIPDSTNTVTLPSPLPKDMTPQILIGKIIKAVLGIVGSLALVMFIYGGFTWMLAGGNAEKVTKGRNILVWATIGLVVIFFSYALVKFVLGAIGAS